MSGEDAVVALLQALSRVGERNSAEIARVIASYFRARDELEPVSRHELLGRLRSGTATVLDVRPEDEFRHGHLPDALNIPLAQLERRLAELPANRNQVAPEQVALRLGHRCRDFCRSGRDGRRPGHTRRADCAI